MPEQVEKVMDTDYFEEPITDLYKQAVAFGIHQTAVNLAATWPEGQAYQEAYWSAWYAGRRAAVALLKEAREMGLTPEQMERLRAKAADVAYD